MRKIMLEQLLTSLILLELLHNVPPSAAQDVAPITADQLIARMPVLTEKGEQEFYLEGSLELPSKAPIKFFLIHRKNGESNLVMATLDGESPLLAIIQGRSLLYNPLGDYVVEGKGRPEVNLSLKDVASDQSNRLRWEVTGTFDSSPNPLIHIDFASFFSHQDEIKHLASLGNGRYRLTATVEGQTISAELDTTTPELVQNLEIIPLDPDWKMRARIQVFKLNQPDSSRIKEMPSHTNLGEHFKVVNLDSLKPSRYLDEMAETFFVREAIRVPELRSGIEELLKTKIEWQQAEKNDMKATELLKQLLLKPNTDSLARQPADNEKVNR